MVSSIVVVTVHGVVDCCVISILFHYYTVSMHDAGNRKVVKSAVKARGIWHMLESDVAVSVHEANMSSCNRNIARPFTGHSLWRHAGWWRHRSSTQHGRASRGKTLATAAAAASLIAADDDDDDDDDDDIVNAAIHSHASSPHCSTARNVDLHTGRVTSNSRVNSRREITPADDVTSCRATTRSLLS